MRLRDHKTKITGFLLAIAGSLVANSEVIRAIITKQQFAWFMAIAGAVVAGLGFLNSQAANRQDEP